MGQTADWEEAERLKEQMVQFSQQGNYAEAARLGEEAVIIREKALGPEHPDTARSLYSLAEWYRTHDDYAKALLLYQRALAILEKILGPDHLDIVSALDGLAKCYERIYERVKDYTPMSFHGAILGIPIYLTNPGILERDQALSFRRRILAIQEKALGPDAPETISSLQKLAGLYMNMLDYAQARLLYQRILASDEKRLGPVSPPTHLYPPLPGKGVREHE